MNTGYIDLHTHFRTGDREVSGDGRVRVVDLGDDWAAAGFSLPAEGWDYFSAGIHPMWLAGDEVRLLARLDEVLTLFPAIIMLGEAGLDQRSHTPLREQLACFEKQVALAEKHRRPLIIHCVRAYNELLEVMKSLRPEMPWILHGFNNHPQLGEQLLANGCYFSLGAALTLPDSNASHFIREIPADRLFLETDEARLPIDAVYEAAAVRRETTPEALRLEVARLFTRLFIIPGKNHELAG